MINTRIFVGYKRTTSCAKFITIKIKSSKFRILKVQNKITVNMQTYFAQFYTSCLGDKVTLKFSQEAQ